MVSIVRRGGVTVSVYAEVGARHHKPHCHVQWADGRCSVSLDGFAVLAGATPPRLTWELLEEFEDVIVATWRELNEAGASR